MITAIRWTNELYVRYAALRRDGDFSEYKAITKLCEDIRRDAIDAAAAAAEARAECDDSIAYRMGCRDAATCIRAMTTFRGGGE